MTYWELPSVPDEWRENLTYIDEIWVPNDFVGKSFAQHLQWPDRSHASGNTATQYSFPRKSILWNARVEILFSF